MLRSSSECLAADDVTIRCRVRHSELASHRSYSEQQEMTCTMRVWHKTSTPSASAVVKQMERTVKKTRSFDFSPHRIKPEACGPELVLTPIQSPVMMVHACCSGEFSEPVPMSKRFTSFGSGSLDRRQVTRQRTSTLPSTPVALTMTSDVTLPVADIMVVDMYGQNGSHQCNITTMSKGYYELTMENRNGQDILLAFLNANLPKERVMGSMTRRTDSELSSSTRSTSARSFDIEAFTAKRMSERMQSETMSEKLRRKVVRVFSSFEEMSAALTDCACGCPKDSSHPDPDRMGETRDLPPPFDELEHATDVTPDHRVRLIRPEEKIKRKQMLQDCNLPSGLSVEDDDGPEQSVYGQ